MKKDVCKYFTLIMVTLLIAIVIYPFLHELGHVIASLLVGAEVEQVTLLPIPSVLCYVGNISNTSKVLIGFGGMILPLLLSLLIPRKWFLTWYIRAVLHGISGLAFLISFISVITGTNPQDDMVQTLNFWGFGKGSLLCVLGLLYIVIVIIIKIDRPLERISKFFEI